MIAMILCSYVTVHTSATIALMVTATPHIEPATLYKADITEKVADALDHAAAVIAQIETVTSA